MERNNIGGLKQPFHVNPLHSLLGKNGIIQKWIGGHDAEAKSPGLASHASCNRSKRYQAQSHVKKCRDGQIGSDAPFTVGNSRMILRDAPRQAQHHRHGMIGNFFQAIGWHIGHPDAQLPGSVEVYVVDADAIAGPPLVAITATRRRTSSAASAGNRSN